VILIKKKVITKGSDDAFKQMCIVIQLKRKQMDGFIRKMKIVYEALWLVDVALFCLFFGFVAGFNKA